MKCTVEMGSGDMIYIQSFLKIARGIQAIVIFCHMNLKCYNIGIADKRNL
jgi:hypothetical protein